MNTDEFRLAAADRGWITPVAMVVALALMLAGAGLRRGVSAPDPWTALIAAGDRLAAGHAAAPFNGKPLNARKAYLLAFHEAVDVGDVEHVLAVADRLEIASEPALAAHVRRAAQRLLDELGARHPLPALE